MTETFTCQALVELVTDYLEGALPPTARAQFETHLAGCPGCTAYLDQMRKTIALAGRLSAETLSEHDKNKLLELFRDWQKTSGTT